MKKKVILFFCILIFVYAAGGTIYYIATREKKDDKPIVTNKDTIKGYDYTLKSNATKLYEDEFKALKANLEGDINYDEYAVSVAKLFVIDLYTINNKINKYDTGGASFVYPDGRDNYKLNVQDTIYKYVEDNTNGKRTQNLPEVSSVIVKDSKKDTYKIGDNSFEAYKINLEWSYVQDLGYDKTGEIILIKKDKNIYVVEKN
ncbi:MAG: hypothetical protein SO009_01430 [Bacilli bacterium]|nr:hypothetical protein [Bacilli bacterium]